jgi:hypothetical protein
MKLMGLAKCRDSKEPTLRRCAHRERGLFVLWLFNIAASNVGVTSFNDGREDRTCQTGKNIYSLGSFNTLNNLLRFCRAH